MTPSPARLASRSTSGVSSLLCLLVSIAGCYQYTPRMLPEVPSPSPVPPVQAPTLRAGFAKADITPPPGVGLFGYGPESVRARGYRMRLYARSLVLEDAAGERLAFVTVDLGAVSPLLHRLAASRVVETTGIGADRLILAATHTHAGPNHYFAAKLYNDKGSGIAGFDTVMVEFLAERIALAIGDAARALRPARAAWGTDRLWGHTRNRSYDAFLLNDPRPSLPSPPPRLDLSLEQRAVDPTWTMLRVDLLDSLRGVYEPAGALSNFAVHGTANPSATDLFDADLHAFLERGLERHIDSLNGRAAGFRAHAVHLVANGTSGDVSPDWPSGSRCPPPKLQPLVRPRGPRSPPPAEAWLPPSPRPVAACLAAAREHVERAGADLSARAIALFDRLGGELNDDMSIGRAFRAVALQGESAPSGLCPKPKMGMAALGGAGDGHTRYHGWRFLGLIDIGYEQGGSAVDKGARDCHAPKRTALVPFHGLIAGPHGFPEAAQFAVARVGGMLVGVLPIEVTTTAGVRMKAAVRHVVGESRLSPDSITLISLANGYLQYVTTAEEYSAQRYEGASNIYGPASARVYGEQLANLAAQVRGIPASSSSESLDSIIAYPGKPKSIFPARSAGPPPDRLRRSFEHLACQGDTTVVRWIDAYPGRLVPADGPLLRIEQEVESEGWKTVVWDDDPRVEVRALRPRGSRGYLWEARWWPESSSGRHRVVLMKRQGFQEVAGRPFSACR